MTPTETGETIDSAAFIQKRNAEQAAKLTGAAPPAIEKPAKVEHVEVKEKENDSQAPIPRRARRELNRLRNDAAELRGRLAAYQELGVKPEVAREAVVSEEDPEPARAGFASDAEYNRALGRWDARQEAKKVVGTEKEADTAARNTEQYRAHVQAMKTKAEADSKVIPDYANIAAAASEDPNGIVVDWSKHDNLLGMIAESDAQAFVLTYLAQHQDQLQKLLDLTPNLGAQLRLFARLEERAESMYTPKQQKEVVQASPQGKERTTHPAEAQAGRNTPERDALKPRPSTEVAARGGSAPPEEPLPGSRAWMERRNQATGGR